MSENTPSPNSVDEALMTRSQEGDTQAFAELYDRHARRAYRIAFSICHNESESEEVVQEGFLLIWRRRSTYQLGRGSFRAWAMGIFRNRAIDLIRSKAARPEGVEVVSPLPDRSSPSTPARVIADEERKSLEASLSQLPTAQAEVISLAFFGELSQTEISDLLHLPHGTVKGRMRLGLEKLRRKLDEEPKERQMNGNGRP